jgi:hypothetical protein
MRRSTPSCEPAEIGREVIAAVVFAAASTLAPCTAGQLRAREHQSSGAAGTIAESITLTNTGRQCRLRGYADLELRNARGALPTTVVRGGPLAFLNRAVRPVVLARGGKATLLLAYSHVPAGPRPCPAATMLRIRPPQAKGWLTLRLRLDPCRRGRIYETPILPGVVPVP